MEKSMDMYQLAYESLFDDSPKPPSFAGYVEKPTKSATENKQVIEDKKPLCIKSCLK